MCLAGGNRNPAGTDVWALHTEGIFEADRTLAKCDCGVFFCGGGQSISFLCSFFGLGFKLAPLCLSTLPDINLHYNHGLPEAIVPRAWQQQGRRFAVIADFARGRVEHQCPPVGNGDGMKFGQFRRSLQSSAGQRFMPSLVCAPLGDFLQTPIEQCMALPSLYCPQARRLGMCHQIGVVRCPAVYCGAITER